ncbi:MAG: hypothetical protein BGO43_14025 [Gammaproteobacteria bacterium 39-13]|nr:hypothetical protein [Gammaproteobacteria bacterium]OJV85802.1 MAG: hypothetical protein BGO43_14025 [Gammaproteobacteria bacterium 39-13]
MKIFGDKEKFAIQFDFYTERGIEIHDDRYLMFGSAFFWVNGKNLFAYRDFGPDATFSYDLAILLDFFCDFLFYHITEDPFPAVTQSKIAVEMLEEFQLVEGEDNDVMKYLDVDWDNVDMDLHEKIYDWNVRHGFTANNGGSFLPHAYLRRVADKIEVSWENNFPYKAEKGEVYMKYKKGVDYVDAKLYKEVIVKFCMELINKFKENFPEKMQENYENLKKAIEVTL